MVEKSSNGAPLWPGPADVSARLDRLEKRLLDLEGLRPAVESALVAQAARIESMLAATRRDLVGAADAARDAATDVVDRATGETAAIGDQVRAAALGLAADADDRQAAVLAAVRATMGPVETLAAAVDALHRQVAGLRDDAAGDRRDLEQLRDRLAELPAAVDSGLRDVTEALTGHRDSMAAEGAAARQAATREATEARARLRDAVTAGVDEVRRAGEDAVTAATARLTAAGERMDQLASGIAALEQALGGHLEELDQRQAVERARLAQAFAEQLADGLSRRERRRLGRRLEVPDPAPASNGTPHPDPSPATGAPPSPPPSPSPAARTPVPAVAGGNPPATADAEERLVADDVPAWDAPAPVAERSPAASRVRPSRRDRPVRPTASEPGDPAAARRALAAVRGLGPARQSALIDRFGTLEGIRDATDDDLLAVRGIGPALLPGIREAAGVNPQ